jgi:large subunit ribosomal protein L24
MKSKLKAELAVTKLRIGDKVVVTAGKSKGEVGNITKILRKKCSAIVHGLNIGYKAVKPNPNKDEQGGIKPIERPINLSNIAILNPNTGKADKLGYKFDDNGKKLRVYKSTNEVVASEK